MLKAILLLVCSVAALRLNPHLMGDEEFHSYIKQYNKQYSPSEFLLRHSIYKQAKKTISRLNEEAKRNGFNTQFGINRFADLSPEEFKAMYKGYKRTNSTFAAIPASPSNVEAPTSFDWRSKGAVTPVKDQGQCGSCWAFSATEGVESAWFLGGHELVELSPQQVVSCDENDGGCNGGDLPTAFEYVKSKGQESGKAYPYTSGNGDTGTCKYHSKDVVAHIKGFSYATTNGDENEMLSALVAHSPLSVCVDASTWQYYTGGVITHGCGTDLDHCVQIVGYDVESKNKIPYWIVRNSWATDWGINGYIYVERNKDECGIAQEATYVRV